ncbi:MAG: hypothetical protein CMB37_03300 [Euryarchaeota archaeon]|nr:hypothetical protein [Euryarchaeota archaeon]
MHRVREVRRRGWVFLVIAALLAISFSSSAQTTEFPSGPGLDWTLPDSHGLFINGDQGQTSLGRILPSETGQPDGEAEFSGTSLMQNLLSVSSEPATQPALLQGNLTVRLFTGLYAEGAQCSGENFLPGTPAGGDTTFYATVMVGTSLVMDNEPSESIVLQYDWNNAHEITITTPIDTLLNRNDTISLDVSVVHNCQFANGLLFWDTYDLPSGIEISADMLTPSLNISVSSNGLPSIELAPHSPFGTDDYKEVKIDVIGPLDSWEQGVHYPIPPEEEQFQSRMKMDDENPPHGIRQTDTGDTAWTWITKNPLDPGMYVIDLCVKTTDGVYTEPCHVIGVLRFEVSEPPSAWIESGWFFALPILGVLGLIGYLLNTQLPPWPVFIVIALLAVAATTSMQVIPEIGPGEQQHETTSPDFMLLNHGGGSTKLSDLLDGKDALVLGVFTAGSPAADLQMKDFVDVQEKLGDEVSFAQIITGENVEMYDADSYAEKLNGSWPLMIDESDAAVANQLPTGIGEGVVVIDSAGYIVDWHVTTMNPIDIEKAVDSSASGGDRNPFEMLAPSTLLILMPLILLGLPKEKIEAPDVVMIPAAGWIGTAGSAAIGFAIWAIPVGLLGILGATLWHWVQAILVGWLIWQSLAMIIWQRIPEIDWISNQVYNRLPDEYRQWRTNEMWAWDTRMGHWMAWLLWLALPTMIGQGFGARVSAGGMGIIMGPIMLLAFIITAGLLTLLIRLVASWGGPVSRLAGTLTRPIAVRSWGTINAGIAIWMLAWFIIGPMMG